MPIVRVAKQIRRSPVEVMETIKDMKGSAEWRKRDIERLARVTLHHHCWFVVAMVTVGRKNHN